ncbi:11102_t:CDS:2, partial [Cetraspora pellucida]
NDERFSHIPEEEKKSIVEKATKISEWLNEKLKAQESLPKYEPPAVMCREIYKERENLVHFASPILSKPKPKPKPEEPKPEEPKPEEPKTEEPKTEESKTEEPKFEEPNSKESNIEEVKLEEVTMTEDTPTDVQNMDKTKGEIKEIEVEGGNGDTIMA